MLGNSITERKIKDRHEKTYKKPDEPGFDSDKIQLNIDQRSYGEQSITNDSDNVNKDWDQEITMASEFLEQTGSMMKESSNEPDQSTTSRNDIPRRVKRQQTQSTRGMATGTRSQSQTHMISHRYLNNRIQSLTLLAGTLRCYFTEIIKSNDPRENCQRW